MTTLSRGNPKFLRQLSCWDGVRATYRSGAGLKRKRKKVLSDGRDLLGRLLLNCPVLWSGQVFLVSGLLMEGVESMVAEWITLAEMLKLQELSLAVSGILKEWLDDQILDSFGEQTLDRYERRVEKE